VGIYNGNFDKLYLNQSIPGYRGLRGDIRWMSFRDEEGNGVLIGGIPRFALMANEYTGEMNSYKARNMGNTSTYINVFNSNVGLNSEMQLQLIDKEMETGKENFIFRFIPIVPDDDESERNIIRYDIKSFNYE
jgi:hypothetical protein